MGSERFFPSGCLCSPIDCAAGETSPREFNPPSGLSSCCWVLVLLGAGAGAAAAAAAAAAGAAAGGCRFLRWRSVAGMPVGGAKQLAIGARALKRKRHTPAAGQSDASLAGAQPQTDAGQAAALALEDARDGNKCVETFLHFGRETGARDGRKVSAHENHAAGGANFQFVYLAHEFTDEEKMQVELAGVRATIVAWELREEMALAGDGVSGVGEARAFAAGGLAKMRDVTLEELMDSLKQSTLTPAKQSIVMQCWKAKTPDQRAKTLKGMVDSAKAILTMNGHATCLFGAHIIVLCKTSLYMS